MKKFKVRVVFKHLPHWSKYYIIEAKSEKKAFDIVRRMFKDKMLDLTVSGANNHKSSNASF